MECIYNLWFGQVERSLAYGCEENGTEEDRYIETIFGEISNYLFCGNISPYIDLQYDKLELVL